jgi:hypothetical protein
MTSTSARPLPTGRHRGFLSAPQHRRTGQGPDGPRPWYRRRLVQAGIVVVIIASAVLTDRYVTYTTPERASSFSSFYQELTGDIESCNDGVVLTMKAWRRLETGGPGAPTVSQVRNLAENSEGQCTPANNAIYVIDSTDVPGALATAYPQLSVAVYDLGNWADPGAAEAMVAIAALAASPGDQSALAKLDQSAAIMQTDSSAVASILSATCAALTVPYHNFDLARPETARI